jgi:1-acyl-sn-glycerol-3-phosphate acyltransferase
MAKLFAPQLLMSRMVLHALAGKRIVKRDFHRYDGVQKAQAVSQWSAGLLKKANVELRIVNDAPIEQPALFVCNHMSWLDIFVLNAWQPAVFVSKSEVAQWPLLGPLISGAGTLFIEREKRRDALKVVHELADVLRAGRSGAVFPEGTTSRGDRLLPFHANLLQAAISAQVPVQPLALRYIDSVSGQQSFAPSYVDDMTLVQSLGTVAKSAPIIAELHVLAPITLIDRRSGASEARTRIAAALGFDVS